MSKRDYRNYRAMSENAVDEAIPANVSEEVKEALEAVEAAGEVEIDVDESVSYFPPEDEPLVGKVAGCKRLNIRSKPSKESEPVCVVEEGTVLMIDVNAIIPKEWFKVYTEAGIEGYCVREFIAIVE